MKRKKAKRGAGAKKPPIPARPLRALGKRTLETVPDGHTVGFLGQLMGGAPARDREEIAGIPLPPDLEPAVRYYAGQRFELLDHFIGEAPWVGWGEERSAADYPDWREAHLNPEDWHQIRDGLERCFRQGFYLALLRYADDLKQSVEAGAVVERLRRNANKGGEARREKAKPAHRAIRKRFKELRKTVPKKTARYLRVAEEFEISDRHVARIVDGLD
jgi:hypothetical protein